MAAGDRIEPSDMELPLPGPVSRVADCGGDLQKERIRSALADNRFVISQTAKALRISRPTLYAMLKRYGIDLPPKRRGVRF